MNEKDFFNYRCSDLEQKIDEIFKSYSDREIGAVLLEQVIKIIPLQDDPKLAAEDFVATLGRSLESRNTI